MAWRDFLRRRIRLSPKSRCIASLSDGLSIKTYGYVWYPNLYEYIYIYGFILITQVRHPMHAMKKHGRNRLDAGLRGHRMALKPARMLDIIRPHVSMDIMDLG